MRVLFVSLILALTVLVRPAYALDAATVEKLAFGESDDKVAAIAALVAGGDEKAAALLQALADGELQTAGKRVLMVKGDDAVDAVSGEKVSPLPADREDVVASNRIRRELGAALAALKLVSPVREVRLAAAKELTGSAEQAMLPLVKKALAQETDPDIKPLLELIQATLELKSGSKDARIAAIRTLGLSNSPSTKTLLLSLLEKGTDGSFAETDETIRHEAQKSLREVEGRLAWGERAGLLFAGVSLGSILLLAALGLAIRSEERRVGKECRL